ncbi:glycosyltransferase family 2 protein [Desulfovibrio inopinatus]|uniref:glycosyltransferase family 2 protein n=1 Tax=Desulfovibrio inopinatus TaxID=102109 RepID=UPI0003F81759|nr:glycosyltransferase family 2 protein [Desulfovibrio inopinatus]
MTEPFSLNTLLVVVPTYNHTGTLPDVVRRIKAQHPHVLVVDDGSDIPVSANDLSDTIDVIRHPVNQGKGAAMKTAAKRARQRGMTHILTIDADGQHFPEDIPRFISAMEQHPESIIVGSRNFNAKNIPGSSRFGRWFSNLWYRIQTLHTISDMQSGFRAYPLTVFEKIQSTENRYSFEIEILVKATWAGFHIEEIDIPVFYPEPDQRISHFKAFWDNARISWLNTRLTVWAILRLPGLLRRRQEKVTPTTRRPSRWSSKSLGSRLQHLFFYAVIRLFGVRPTYVVLAVITAYYTLWPSIRARSKAYLVRRFSNHSRIALFVYAFRLHFEFGKILVDRAAMGIQGRHHVELDDNVESTMRTLLARGRGLLVLTAHVGCWQTAMSGFELMNTRTAILLHRDAGDVDRQYFEHTGKKAPFRFIDPLGTLGGVFEIMEELRHGAIVAMTADRVLGNERNVVSVDLFGEPVQYPYSAFSLASAMNAPVIVLFSARTGPEASRLWIGDIIEVPSGLGREAAPYVPYVQRFASCIEVYATANPFQYFNFVDIWSNDEKRDGHKDTA